MRDEALETLEKGLLELDMDSTLDAAERILARSDDLSIAKAIDATSQALQIVGRRFQEGEWFLNELIYAGGIAEKAMDRFTRALQGTGKPPLGTIVVGTVAHDTHDLGKNIFVGFARGAGFRVVDLGVSVPTDRFLDAIREHSPLALGMSCLLTPASAEVGRAIQTAREHSLRDRVKILVGGAALTEEFASEVGADAFAPDAVSGVDILKLWS